MTIFALAKGAAAREGLPMDAMLRHEPTRAEPDFASLVEAVLTRALAQMGRSVLSESELKSIAREVLAIGREGGWAFRFSSSNNELPLEMVRAWQNRLSVLALGRSDELGNVYKQLLKGCFQASPERCRDSYRETDSAGRCRRQERDYDLNRISGAHCVDCPYWCEKEAEMHLEWLGNQWLRGASELKVGRDIYLPEDFRALRRWRPPTFPTA